MAKEISSCKLPSLSEILGLNKFDITRAQLHDCITLYNHYGEEAAKEQAKKFEEKNNELK